jgi:CHAD domain-containing protein
MPKQRKNQIWSKPRKHGASGPEGIMKDEEKAASSPPSRALKLSLQRALRYHRAAKKLKPDAVHDFRVALRRCRSVAEGLSSIDADSAWKRLRKASKRQQGELSNLRDVQVLQNWLKPVGLTSGPVGEALACYLCKQEREFKREARDSLRRFPRRRWKRWLGRLPKRADAIRLNQRQLAQVVLDRLAHVIELHENWSKEPTPEAWHELRMTVKRFRYVVESFLPDKAELWGAELQRAQDLLGEAHDLDVLDALITKLSRRKALRKHEAAIRSSLRRVQAAAENRRKEYVRLVSGSQSDKPRRNAAEIGGTAEDPGRETMWHRWRGELLQQVKANRRGAGASEKSTRRKASRAAGREGQSPSRPSRISLVR